jgi:hypothetical protein
MSAPRGTPFAAGNTAGRGRPKGSRNKAGSPDQDALETYGPKLILKCISMAGQGHLGAMRLCLERYMPVRRESPIRLVLPKTITAGDLGKTAEEVTRAVLRGNITPTEGEKMMNILHLYARIIDTVDLASEVEKIKAHLAAAPVSGPQIIGLPDQSKRGGLSGMPKAAAGTREEIK